MFGPIRASDVSKLARLISGHIVLDTMCYVMFNVEINHYSPQ